MKQTYAFQPGFMTWQYQAMHRRRVALATMAQPGPAQPLAASRRYQLALPACPIENHSIIRIGEFVISPEGDPRILGHPHIRY